MKRVVGVVGVGTSLISTYVAVPTPAERVDSIIACRADLIGIFEILGPHPI
ncbi:MAG TPA: hypothetical protein VGR53_04485 [Nitrososphaerales archaeon]|nr:hypothetical protein [Nitrososphaerales archaeon]